MIVDFGTYYLYRHIRLDTNKVFYIGIGKNKDRLKRKTGRNKEWLKIIGETDYDAEILLYSNDRDFILKKEKEFIKLYGRSDLGIGGLCNLTDGGNFGNANKEAYKRGEGHPNAIPVHLYNKEGDFLCSFKTRIDCAKSIGIELTTLCKCAKTKTSMNEYLFLDEYCGKKIDVTSFCIRRPLRKPIWAINPLTKDNEMYFESTEDAARFINTNPRYISMCVNKNKIHKGWKWRHADYYEYIA